MTAICLDWLDWERDYHPRSLWTWLKIVSLLCWIWGSGSPELTVQLNGEAVLAELWNTVVLLGQHIMCAAHNQETQKLLVAVSSWRKEGDKQLKHSRTVATTQQLGATHWLTTWNNTVQHHATVAFFSVNKQRPVFVVAILCNHGWKLLERQIETG